MSIKTQLAKTVAKSSHWLLQNVFHKNATSLPGKLALKIDPNILKNINKNFQLIIVTGTNGKTLTTALISQLLKTAGYNVITNPSGSNMIQGIAGTLLTNKNKTNNEKTVAVLEIDEANVPIITKYLTADYFVLTNIFRDQLDRYGEIYTTYDMIINGIKNNPNAKILLNGDSPIFTRGDFSNQRIYYGFDHIQEKDYQDLKAPNNTDGILSSTDHSVLHYNFITYANLGKYFSVTDDFKRPSLTYFVDKITELTPTYSKFSINQRDFKIEIGGLYNIYNALAAYSVAKEFNVSDETIAKSFESNQQIFGRQESIKIDDKEVVIVLIKNPVGTNSIIDMIATDQDEFSLIALLNANYADGIDTSWIWDAEFERLHDTNLKHLITGGERYKDIHVRLKMAGFEDNNSHPNLENVIESIKSCPSKKVYIAATYTAMLQLRQALINKNYIKSGME